MDRDHRLVAALAERLARPDEDEVAFARRTFDHVRDQVKHSYDAGDPRVTVSASDVVEHGVGPCCAKSHLLVAVLRRHGVPAGFCYQRLADGAGGHVIHGVVAAWLHDGWHRLDPRRNRPGLDAQFDLSAERLAFQPDPAAGEVDYPTVFAAPVAEVLEPLCRATEVRTAPLLAELPA